MAAVAADTTPIKTRIFGDVGNFVLAVKKCTCRDYVKLHIFPYHFLKFHHLEELYPGKKLYFNSDCTVPIPTDTWKNHVVATTLAAVGVRPYSTVPDIMTYRVFLQCDHTSSEDNS
jgi:hypothetical protein